MVEFKSPGIDIKWDDNGQPKSSIPFSFPDTFKNIPTNVPTVALAEQASGLIAAGSSTAPPAGSTPKLQLDQNIMALIQKGKLQRPGFFGNQELKNSNKAFNNAVDIASAYSGFAANLKKAAAPPANYVRSETNYILTELEKMAIENKAQELASFGVVPQDVLSQFFYILAATENQSDLEYIGLVTGIYELNDPRYIRNIRDVTLIPNIYKVGYLANGVSSVTNRFAGRFATVENNAYPTGTSYGSVLDSSSFYQNLGVIGPIALSSAAGINMSQVSVLANAPALATGIAIATTIDALSGLAGGPTSLSQLQIQTILNPTAAMTAAALTVGSNAINSMLSASPLGGAMASLGSLGGVAAALLLGQSGGQAMGGFMSKLLTGARIASATLANNPTLIPPSYAGKSFFGESGISLPAIDQTFCRKIGAFGATSGASGTMSFGMQNFASMGGSLPINSVITNMLIGTTVVPAATNFFGKEIAEKIGNVCSILNVAATATIEMRRSDNAIPLMIGMSSAIAGESFSPFGSSTFSNGWKLASSTANDVQKYNPQFLETCRTSL